MQRRPSPPRAAQEELNRAQIEGELSALRNQREELQSQMNQLSGRRNQLDEQRNVAPSGQARSQLESQMAQLDARSVNLEMQIMGLNDRISTAMGRLAELPAGADRVVRIPEIRMPDFQFPPARRGPDMEVIGGIMAAEAIGLVLIGVVAWRFGMKRIRDQFDRMFAQQSTQVNQLQQAVDVIGIEVERISEGQRYVAKMLTAGAAEVPGGRKEAGGLPVPAKREG